MLRSVLSTIIITLTTVLGCQVKGDISLEEAAATGKVDVVKQRISDGVELNTKNPSSGATPLIAAIVFGQDETASLLIDAGADIEAQDKQGSTALVAAAFFCRTEILKLLIQKGAKKDIENSDGATPFDTASAPFSEVKPAYEFFQSVLGPFGLTLDLKRIENTRPKIAAILEAG